jgi:hypothetical protein
MIQLQTAAIDTFTTVQKEFLEYLEAQSLVITSINSFWNLEVATQNIVSHAKFLAQQKELLSRSEYRKLLELYGWKGEEKKYLRIATAFKNFTPEELAGIEPTTIFRLANNLKKYQVVIDELKNLPSITQEAVRALMEKARADSEPKEEEKPSIWRRTRDGRRYCQIPPIHEENHETGTRIQRMMDEEGLTAQQIVAEGISLREAFTQGRLIFISPVDTSDGDSEEPEQGSTEEGRSESGRERLSEYSSSPHSLTLSLSHSYSGAEESFDTSSPLLPDLYEQQKLRGDGFIVVDSNTACDEENTENSDGWSFEPEEDGDDLVTNSDDEGSVDITTTASPTEEESSGCGAEDGDGEALAPVEVLIETFQTATSWAEIREVLLEYNEYKQEAWEALTPVERRRVMAMMPDDVKKLSKAKKAGVIDDFKEVREGFYQIRRAGNLFWEPVSSWRLDAVLGGG